MCFGVVKYIFDKSFLVFYVLFLVVLLSVCPEMLVIYFSTYFFSHHSNTYYCSDWLFLLSVPYFHHLPFRSLYLDIKILIINGFSFIYRALFVAMFLVVYHQYHADCIYRKSGWMSSECLCIDPVEFRILFKSVNPSGNGVKKRSPL